MLLEFVTTVLVHDAIQPLHFLFFAHAQSGNGVERREDNKARGGAPGHRHDHANDLYSGLLAYRDLLSEFGSSEDSDEHAGERSPGNSLPRGALKRVRAGFTGANAYGLGEVIDKDFAVTNLARLG